MSEAFCPDHGVRTSLPVCVIFRPFFLFQKMKPGTVCMLAQFASALEPLD